MMMTVAAGKKQNKVLVSGAINPRTLEVLKTYALHQGIELTMLEVKDGVTSRQHLETELAQGSVAGVIVQQPNVYGIIEDFTGFADACHDQKALFVIDGVAADLAVLKTPAEWGADIAVGDAQTLGIPLCYGGPYVGFMACTQAHMRKLPGRIVGEARDSQGRRCFVLTLQAREQHIRREKATSNICSNQSLMALWVTVYLSLMGPEGMRKVNDLCFSGAHYLFNRLLTTGKFRRVSYHPFIKEFPLEPLVDPAALQELLCKAGYFGALLTEEGYVTFCVTEKRTKEEMDAMVELIKEARL
jgi:glycine dehydrogenase subunit 1